MKRNALELKKTGQLKAEALIARVSQAGEGGAVELAQLLAALPMLFESALGYLLSEFDYEANQQSNTAIAARLLATGADRFRRLEQGLVR